MNKWPSSNTCYKQKSYGNIINKNKVNYSTSSLIAFCIKKNGYIFIMSLRKPTYAAQTEHTKIKYVTFYHYFFSLSFG